MSPALDDHFEPIPDSSEHSQSQVSDCQQSTNARRNFLRRSAVAVGIASTSSIFLAGGAQEAQAQGAGRVSLRDQLRLVQRHENDHVQFLLTNLGSFARPKPTFQNITSSNLANFLSLGRALENTGVGAYLGAAPLIFDRNILAAAGSIALVEARHAGMFNSIQSRPMTENVFGQELSFERALTIDEVIAQAGPYIASLNGGPPLGFSNTPSTTNDIDILNFALALEYLEAEYYNINVPRFYP